MDTERWEKIANVHASAIECEPAAREEFLDQACKDDPDLRHEVETLLAQDRTPGILDGPMWDAAAQMLVDAPTIVVGTLLGHYRIEELVGAGGMGQVFRATDPRLNRSVAIKVLSPSVAIAEQVRARFGREAQTGAALTHPHICTLHDVGRHDGVDFLVMEYLDGQTLETCLEQGPLPLARAVRYAVEIASALDHAHRQGIVHRDVKPANIMLTGAGAKLMDFGIAKRQSPGLDLGGGTITEEGAILGTIRYMSPEQLEGKVVDHRSDIFSFGAVVYEMVTGQPAFRGGSAASVMAAVLQHEPPALSTLPQSAPPLFDHIVRRCLAKDVGERWQSAGDVMRELKWFADNDHAITPNPDPAVGSTPMSIRSVVPRLLPWGIAAALAVALALLALRGPWNSAVTPARARFRIDAQVARTIVSSVSNNRLLAISPAGTHIVYVSRRYGENRGLMIHALDRLEDEPLPGTANALAPFFSPDGRSVGFFDTATREIKVVALAGDVPRMVCRLDEIVSAASWSSNGTIVFATRNTATGLMSVPAEGGQPKLLTKPDASRNEIDHVFPSVLPDGRSVLFTITRSGRAEQSDLAVLDMQDVARGYTTMLAGAGNGEYLQSGHVVYVSGTSLYGARFDPARRRIVGDAVTLEKDIAVERETRAAQYAVSRSGTLIYIPASVVGVAASRTIVWVDRKGNEESIDVPGRAYHSLRLSPDGTRVALDARDEESDTWVWDFRRSSFHRVTFTPRNNPFPMWTRDGRWIVTGDAPGLVRWPADGSGLAEPLTRSDHTQFPQAMTPDDKTLVLTDVDRDNSDLTVLTLDGKGQSKRLLDKPYIEGPADLSPDGRWLAYQQSDEAGRREIYVSPFPDVMSQRLFIAQGKQPIWARDRRDLELFYVADSGMLTSVTVSTTAKLGTGSVKPLFSTKPYFAATQGRSHDVALDGQRFVFIKDAPVGDGKMPAISAHGSIVIVTGWIDELKARLAAPE